MRVRALVAAGLVAGTMAVVGGGAPAGAAVLTTSVGTTVLAVVTGEAGTEVRPTCQGGSVAVGGVTAVPAVACGAVTAITIQADGASQVLTAEPAPLGSMPALASVTIDAGSGSDDVTGSTVSDTITLGAEDDELFLPATGGDDTVDGTPKEVDSVDVIGTDGDDEIVLSSPDPDADVATISNGSWSATVEGPLGFIVHAGDGDDTVDASAMVAGTNEGIDLHGEGGDDRLVAADHPSGLHGGTGTNELVGGPAPDGFVTSSPTDELVLGDDDSILDAAGPVGRDLGDLTDVEGLRYSVEVHGNADIRVAQSGATAVVTVAGARTGRQVLTDAVARIGLGTHRSGAPRDRVTAEIVTLADQEVDVTGGPGTVVDVIVPLGTWGIGGGEVDPDGPYQSVYGPGAGGQMRARNPLLDANDRFALRSIRDLQGRNPDPQVVEQGGDLLRDGAITRTSVAQGFTSNPDFRQIQVDGAYAEILGRTADDAGTGYWVDRLGDGLILRKLRASFYGTPEAYALRGGTLPSFVTSVYEEVLLRTPQPSEVAYWVGVIQAGVPRGTVADRFLNTPEARTTYVADRFLAYADRLPSAAEVQTWLPTLGSSRSDGRLALIRSLIASRAYFLRPEVQPS